MTTATQIRSLTQRFQRARTIDERLELAAEIRKAAETWEVPAPVAPPQPEQDFGPLTIHVVPMPGSERTEAGMTQSASGLGGAARNIGALNVTDVGVAWVPSPVPRAQIVFVDSNTVQLNPRYLDGMTDEQLKDLGQQIRQQQQQRAQKSN